MGKGSRSPRSRTLQHSQPPANSTGQPLPEPGDSHTDTLTHPDTCPAENWSEPFPTRPPLPPPTHTHIHRAHGRGQGRRPSIPRAVLSPSRGAGHTHLPSVHPACQDSTGQLVLSRKPPAGASGRHGQAQGPPGPASCFPLPTPLSHLSFPCTVASLSEGTRARTPEAPQTADSSGP